MEQIPSSKLRAIFGNHCDESRLTTTKLPVVGNIRCHKKILRQLRGAMREAQLRGLSYCFDVKDTKESGGCYVCRKMRGSNNWSRHAWGIAFDFNPSYFPYPYHGGASRKWGKRQARLQRVFEHWGFGFPGRGRFSAYGPGRLGHDPMHAEICVLFSRPTLLRFYNFLRILGRR